VEIQIRGVSEHNLKEIDVSIGDGLTVVTGVSGSGKTSLVFDTLYHEARRRLLDVISTSRPGGWRHQLSPAKVESITGLGPAVAVGQNVLNRNPLSTLASAAGLHPFLRLLYANFGARHCPRCGSALSVFSEDEIVERLLTLAEQQPLRIFAPLLHGVQGSHRTLLALLAREFGAEALWVDGSRADARLWQSQTLDPEQPHDLDVELGRTAVAPAAPDIRELVQRGTALGTRAITVRGDRVEVTLASAPVCAACGTWFADVEPKHFHTPCPYCEGKGCPRCDGSGMHPQAAGVRWQDLRFPELLAHPVTEVRRLLAGGDLPSTAGRLRSEIERRLDALDRVGLGYLTLDRPSPTLSRGEAQRVRLAVALTSRLEDMLHVLDEPTIGQHPADVARFLPALRDLAGPVVYVEHDRMAAAVADRAIDLGPGAGVEGGEVVFVGVPADLWAADTATGRYFSLRDRVMSPEPRPTPERFLTVRGAVQHNLKDIDVPIALGRLTVITGVSGSGKSTLVEHVLVPSLEGGVPTGCRAVEGPVTRAILVDQSPIGCNPRSNPATYTKLSDVIRELYAGVTGLSASHFSFNRPEGACPTCKGMGAVEVKMQYLYSVWIRCSDCEGQRFNEEVLAARIPFSGRKLSIADFYQLSIGEVAALFAGETRLPPGRTRTARRILRALTDVGLGYLPLGQPSPTLSGGEAQRVKLTKYLGRSRLADRLLVLDEPSTGLHPQDLDGLLVVLDRLVRSGATVVVVEHNTDVIRAADWIVDLGPGAGPDGGRVLYAGPPQGLLQVEASVTAQALGEEARIQPGRAAEATGAAPDLPIARSEYIAVRNARANNLRGVDVEIPKGKLTVVTGPSGSGKSSLVGDVLEAEAKRRYLESLSMYERQGTREGPEAPVDSVSGLGVTLTVTGLQTHMWSTLSHFTRRASVGRATELSHHLAVLLATIGQRSCLACGAQMARTDGSGQGEVWACPACGATAPIAQPRHFSTANYASACDQCTGVGTMLMPQPEKLIIHPEKPLCSGAMYSPGYWPQTYLCQDTGYVQALGARYGFDPGKTPWNEMAEEAQQAFLFGDDEPLERTYRSKGTGRIVTRTDRWEGFYGGWVRNWDVHGTYTRTVPCPGCGGAGLRPEYLAVTLAGHNMHGLCEMPLERLDGVLAELAPLTGDRPVAGRSLDTARRRLRFLCQVGLGYLHLNRPSGTLSAGEAQRIQLAGLLGSGLTSLTVLLDEPSRGMHPCELEALREALAELRDEGNTVVVVEHDLLLIEAADHVVDLGPGAGAAGGRIVACGTPQEIARADTATGRWLRGGGVAAGAEGGNGRRKPRDWLVIRGARENNLRGETVEIPLGTLVGVCGVSGSGKSTLLIDTLGRALVRQAHTTSFAREPSEPGEYEAIEGAPARAVLVDQARRGIRSPAVFLGLIKPLLKLYAASHDAQALGLDQSQLGRPCSACKGRGQNRIEMGFLPDLFVECETCRGTGYLPEAWQVRVRGVVLPEVNALTLDQICELFGDEERIARPLQAARDVGLGYLVWRQPAYTLSGGEAQRLKIAKELGRRVPGRKAVANSLYILDEPTVGQHMEDVARLVQVLHRLVEGGHTVVLIEHHAHVLAACDWLIELGPGGGPDGGRVIAAGTPEAVAATQTPTAPYLRPLLTEVGQ
jgi:excinuclease ABC subunit A